MLQIRIGIRMGHSGVETGVSLFAPDASSDSIQQSKLVFQPPSCYYELHHPWSAVVGRGQQIDELPKDSDSSSLEGGDNSVSDKTCGQTLFSVSLFHDDNQSGRERGFASESEADLTSEPDTDTDTEMEIEESAELDSPDSNNVLTWWDTSSDDIDIPT